MIPLLNLQFVGHETELTQKPAVSLHDLNRHILSHCSRSGPVLGFPSSHGLMGFPFSSGPVGTGRP